MTAIYDFYGEVAEVMAQLAPEQIMDLKASPQTHQRFDELMGKYKSAAISKEEKDELDHFIVLDRLIRMAKIKVGVD